MPEPDNLTRPDGTHRIELVWISPVATVDHPLRRQVRYWASTPRVGEWLEIVYGDDLASIYIGKVTMVTYTNRGVPQVQFE